MPLALPNLDDRSFADLVDEARALIPSLAPEWTDHNPADPGVTLVELFAWLTEMLLYRVNQVTDGNRRAFLRLINGPKWKENKTLAEEIRDTVVNLRKPQRAVTAADFERIALGVQGVARAYCVPRRNLEGSRRESRCDDRPADVSIVVVPREDAADAASLPTTVRRALESAILLTTRLRVISVRQVPIGLDLTVRDRAHAAIVDWRRDPPHAAIILAFTIYGRPDRPGAELLAAAETALQHWFDPYKRGSDKLGWPFGRPVYVSEVWERLAALEGVDFVTAREHKAEPGPDEQWRILKNSHDELEAIGLEPHELPAAVISSTVKDAHVPHDPLGRRR